MFLAQPSLASSHGLGWGPIEIETHDCSSIAMPSQVTNRHVLTFHDQRGGPIEIGEYDEVQTHNLREGSFCLSPAGLHPAARWSTRRQITFVGFETDWWSRISELSFDCHILPGRYLNAMDSQVSHLLAALLAEIKAGNPSGPLFAELLSRTLVIRLCTAYSANPTGSPFQRVARAGGLAGWRLQSVIDRMRDDLSRTPSLQELSALARLHPDHFARAFRQTTGLPPHRYLMKARVDAAAELLIRSDTPAAGLARQLGFSDQSHFQNVFRRHMGVTPRQYRDQNRCTVAVRQPLLLFPAVNLQRSPDSYKL